MEKNYNFERKKLMLPEYGRHVHEMVDYLRTIHDRDLRNLQAQVVIEVMGNLNPILRDTVDFKHKLWDHLFIMADFQLDVDSPYPIPSQKILYPRPDKMEYPNHKIRRKHYGKYIEKMLHAIALSDDESAKALTVENLAKYMRVKSFEYNREHPNNQVIVKDIQTMSDHQITLDESALNGLKNDYKQPQTNNKQRKNFPSVGHNSGYGGHKSSPYGGKSNGGKRKQSRPNYK